MLGLYSASQRNLCRCHSNYSPLPELISRRRNTRMNAVNVPDMTQAWKLSMQLFPCPCSSTPAYYWRSCNPSKLFLTASSPSPAFYIKFLPLTRAFRCASLTGSLVMKTWGESAYWATLSPVDAKIRLIASLGFSLMTWKSCSGSKPPKNLPLHS